MNLVSSACCLGFFDAHPRFLLWFTGLLLLDNNSLGGNLTEVCSIESLEIVYIDCVEVSCPEECCKKCCTDGEECHDYDQ
jgi:hypothetical protein